MFTRPVSIHMQPYIICRQLTDQLASAILAGTGSVGLSLIYWFIGFVISVSSLAVYLEYASYFPNRSGSEAVYLEQAFPRPRYFFPIAFAVQSVILSFSSGNAIGTMMMLDWVHSADDLYSTGKISLRDERARTFELGVERSRDRRVHGRRIVSVTASRDHPEMNCTANVSQCLLSTPASHICSRTELDS